MKIFRARYCDDDQQFDTAYAVCDDEKDIPGILARRFDYPERLIHVVSSREIGIEEAFVSELTMADFLRLTAPEPVKKIPGMSIKITVYEHTGKYYTEWTATNGIDIPMFRPEFEHFVRDNLPAEIDNGYITVEDAQDGQSFHQRLYTYKEIMNS